MDFNIKACHPAFQPFSLAFVKEFTIRFRGLTSSNPDAFVTATLTHPGASSVVSLQRTLVPAVTPGRSSQFSYGITDDPCEWQLALCSLATSRWLVNRSEG